MSLLLVFGHHISLPPSFPMHDRPHFLPHMEFFVSSQDSYRSLSLRTQAHTHTQMCTDSAILCSRLRPATSETLFTVTCTHLYAYIHTHTHRARHSGREHDGQEKRRHCCEGVSNSSSYMYDASRCATLCMPACRPPWVRRKYTCGRRAQIYNAHMLSRLLQFMITHSTPQHTARR